MKVFPGAEYKPGYVDGTVSNPTYASLSAIYLSSLPPDNGRAALRCRYT